MEPVSRSFGKKRGVFNNQEDPNLSDENAINEFKESALPNNNEYKTGKKSLTELKIDLLSYDLILRLEAERVHNLQALADLSIEEFRERVEVDLTDEEIGEIIMAARKQIGMII